MTPDMQLHSLKEWLLLQVEGQSGKQAAPAVGASQATLLRLRRKFSGEPKVKMMLRFLELRQEAAHRIHYNKFARAKRLLPRLVKLRKSLVKMMEVPF